MALDVEEYVAIITNALIRDDWAKANQVASESLDHFPDESILMYLKGSICAYLKDMEGAMTWLEASTKERSDFFYPAIFQLGLIHFTSGNLELSDSTWESLSELDSNHYFNYFRRGMKLFALSELVQAESEIKEGISLNSELPSLNKDMEIVLRRISNIGDAGQKDNPYESLVNKDA